MPRDFSYKHEIFDLTTENKQQSFYYRLSKSAECCGNYTARIAFYDSNNKLLYYRLNHWAHFFSIDKNMGFVKWSKDGTMALFYEFRTGRIADGGVYDYMLLHLKKRIAYRIDLYKYEHKFLDDLPDNFIGNDVIHQLIELGVPTEPFHVDKVRRPLLSFLFKTNFIPRSSANLFSLILNSLSSNKSPSAK